MRRSSGGTWTPARQSLRHWPPIETLPAASSLQAGHRAQHGRLAATRRADQHADLPGLQAERHRLDRRPAPAGVAHADLVELQEHEPYDTDGSEMRIVRIHWALTPLSLLLSLPVLGVLGSWLALDAGGMDTLAHQFATVLPDYALQSAVLAAAVAVGVALLGGATAAAVTLFEFPGRRFFEWALLLPLAMPAYVLAYAYTDFLQYAGPLQTTLRELTGARGALWPDVRSLPGAVVLFVLCLYPYVYLLTRAALGERAVQMMEAARLLGAGVGRRVLRGGAAAGPAGARSRRGAGADGDAGRLRRRVVLRPEHASPPASTRRGW